MGVEVPRSGTRMKLLGSIESDRPGGHVKKVPVAAVSCIWWSRAAGKVRVVIDRAWSSLA